jgi:hypothetical protein
MRMVRAAAVAAGSVAIAGAVATPASASSPAGAAGQTVRRVTVEGPALCVQAPLAHCSSVRLQTTGYDVTHALPQPGSVSAYFFWFSSVPASQAATLTLTSAAGSCRYSVSTRPIFRSLTIVAVPPCGVRQLDNG